MDEVMFLAAAFAAAAWGVSRLIETGIELTNHIKYWRNS